MLNDSRSFLGLEFANSVCCVSSPIDTSTDEVDKREMWSLRLDHNDKDYDEEFEGLAP